jgi:hypothetical protein
MNETSKEKASKKLKETPKEQPKEKQTEKPNTKLKTAIVPDAELLDLTGENFVAVMQKLGGKDVTTAMMLPYFKISKDPCPQHRWPKLRTMADKLSKQEPPKVAIAKTLRGKKSVFKYSLSG